MSDHEPQEPPIEPTPLPPDPAAHPGDDVRGRDADNRDTEGRDTEGRDTVGRDAGGRDTERRDTDDDRELGQDDVAGDETVSLDAAVRAAAAGRPIPVDMSSMDSDTVRLTSSPPPPDPDPDPSDQSPHDRQPREPSDASDAPPPVPTASPGSATGRWGRGLRDLLTPRFTGAGAVIALLIGLLGFALIAQVKTNDNSSTLSTDRPDDLVRILSDLDSRKDRLNTEITNLQETQRQLSSGAESKQAALNAAAQRANELGILAGTLPAQGPGVQVAIRPTRNAITAAVVLDAVEELRGAGAEAMQINGSNGPTVRIVASTWFVDGSGGVVVSGTTLTGTLTLTAIGDGQTMQTALTIPGGVDDTVQNNGGTVLVTQQPLVRVTALAPAVQMKYAHPVS